MPHAAALDRTALPRTDALRRALREHSDGASAADLLFLEAWEAAPWADVGVALRVHQIRRANPALAAEIRAELDDAGRGRAAFDFPSRFE